MRANTDGNASLVSRLSESVDPCHCREVDPTSCAFVGDTTRTDTCRSCIVRIETFCIVRRNSIAISDLDKT